jgi:2-polyprenyl-6-methoxyphenol hydroxylase-like FAD-dependent oxidoreductase
MGQVIGPERSVTAVTRDLFFQNEEWIRCRVLEQIEGRRVSFASQDPVVIVGGGIAGLALARMLEMGGVPYVLVERRLAPQDGGLAINLPGNAIQALAALGLRDRVEALGHPIRRREYRTARDKLLFEIDEDAFWGEALRPRSMRRAALVSMLGEGLDPGRHRLRTEVRSLALHSARPRVLLTDGSTLTASLIVGADGVRSTVRQELFGSLAVRGHAVLADASWRFMAPNPGIDCWTVWAGTDGMVLLMPVDQHEVYGWAAITRPHARHLSRLSLIDLAQQMPDRVRETVAAGMMRASGLYHSPLEEVRLERWHGKCAVLIGDAAHATAPVWAEGAALGMEDAIVLGRMLTHGGDMPAMLVEFEAQRRARVGHVQAQTDAMSRAAKLPPVLRNLLLPFVGPKTYHKTYGPLMEPV